VVSTRVFWPPTDPVRGLRADGRTSGTSAGSVAARSEVGA